MKTYGFILIKLLVLLGYLSLVLSQLDYDYFYFVQTWPGSFQCDHRCTQKAAENFGIHGLWPQRLDGQRLEDCDENDRLVIQSKDLVKALKKEWPALSCTCSRNNPWTFWSHEWLKHGTCSKHEIPQLDYFRANLYLKYKTNILGNLAKKNIEPNGEDYYLSNIIAALTLWPPGETRGIKPGVSCNQNDTGGVQIYEIYFCVAKNGTSLIHCPNTGKKFPWLGSCPQRGIRFPIYYGDSKLVLHNPNGKSSSCPLKILDSTACSILLICSTCLSLYF